LGINIGLYEGISIDIGYGIWICVSACGTRLNMGMSSMDMGMVINISMGFEMDRGYCDENGDGY